MLNARKLIYLLPEVCFVAELIPAKKPHTFGIHSFRQINATFMEDEELVTENAIKLFKKLDPDTYTLILPDFLFTNTIVDVNESSEDGVRKHLLEKLLPSLGLNKETHQLETFILAQHQKKTKVQLSGLEKSVLGPIYPIAQERKIVIDAVCPLSWTVKSLISLEPSLSAIEMGKHIYVAQHYIGIDQSVFFPTSELANLAESVKTLKGAEPNLQTLYLLTSEETETEIKTSVKKQIPLQQLAESDSAVEGLPAHVKTAIEAAAKTLDIIDYPVPRFVLEEYVPSSGSKAEIAAPDIPAPVSPIPQPTLSTPKPMIVEESLGDDDDELLPVPSLPSAQTPISNVAAAAPVAPVVSIHAETEELSEIADEPMGSAGTQFVDRPTIESSDLSDDTENEDTSDWLDHTPENDQEELEEEPMIAPISQPATTSYSAAPVRQRPIIKNHNGNGSLLRMIGITIAALIVTVAVGVGVGFAMLKTGDKNAPVNQALTPSPKASPVAEVSPSPSAASPSASVTPIATTKDKMKILVVNATGVSGLAGKTKTALTTAGYKTVDTGNAKGKYETGNFALMAADNSEVLAQLQSDSKLELAKGTVAKTTEDATGKYDVVIVLAEAP
jgi:hypothetical protein